MSEETYRFNVGTMECMVIMDSSGPVTLEQIQGLFPNAAQDELVEVFNRIPPERRVSCMNCLLVNTGDRLILVDTGMGLGSRPRAGHLLDNLTAAGVHPEAINIVMITHCHGDHINGLTDDDGNLTYPNAIYIMGRVEWNYWMDEKRLAEMDQTRAMGLLKKLDPIKLKLTLVDEDTQIAPGVRTLAAYGHTPGHTGLVIESEGETLLAIVDSVHRVVQMHNPSWSPTFDSQPEVSPVTRRAALERAADSGALTLAYHLPFPGLGYVSRQGNGFSWKPL